MLRSVKIAAMEVSLGDIVAVAAADDSEEEDAPPLALLQALWQTAKGQHALVCMLPDHYCCSQKAEHSHVDCV